MKKISNRADGFSLIELIMIIVVTGIAVVPVTNMILQGVRGTVNADIATIAPSLAQEKMEEIRQRTFSSVSGSSGVFPSPFSSYKYEISVNYVDGKFKSSAGKSPYKKVEVNVLHSSGKTFTLTTVMADHD